MNPRQRLVLLTLPVFALAGCAEDSAQPNGDPNPATQSANPTDSEDSAPSTRQPGTVDLSTFSDPAPTGKAGQPRGLYIDADTVDRTDADEVARVFALTKLSPDTQIDVTPADADRRAAEWMTDEYAESQTKPRDSTGGADWIALAANEGYQSAELADTAAMQDGLITTGPEDLTAERPYIATISENGYDMPKETFAVVVYLTRTQPGADWGVYDWYQETTYE